MNSEGSSTPRHSVSVAGVILNPTGDSVLLIQRRDNGRWEPPGGVLELAETIEEGLRREIREETGVEVHVERLTGVYKNMTRGIVALVYRCGTSGEPRPSTNEATAVRWQPLGDISNLMSPAYAIRVLDAIGPDQPARIRAHDGANLI